MNRLRQDKRIASLQTSLGSEVLVLTRFEGLEGLSELFEYRIDALSEEENIDFGAALGQNCAVRCQSYRGAERFFNGVLVKAQWVGMKDTYYDYRLVLRPWLWLLSHTTNCRIFANKNAPGIIEKVFSDAGFDDFQLNLSEDYPEMEYCVQYRETDLAFVNCLMEQYGIYHYFEHTRDKHTLVLADAKSSHSTIGTIPFLPIVGGERRKQEHIYQWVSERQLQTGRIAVNDYDFLQPHAKLLSEAQANETYSRSSFEIYDYPCKYPRKDPESQKKLSDGDRFAKIRLQAKQAADYRRHTAGDAVSLFPGGLFTLEQHPSRPENGEHLVVRASHTLSTESYRSGTSEGADEVYRGQYELQRSDRPFRAPLATGRPAIYGVQTAVVVGPAGEEIYTDKLGRIKVQFHWDRQGNRDEKSSCWIRVAQTAAGRKWGSFQLPRIGQEVVVAFLEGDPDRPLVTGCVYNADQVPPNDLPKAKMVTGFITNSTKGGGGSNSMFADDTKGKEKLSTHAQYDMSTEVEHDQTCKVGNDQSTTVTKNRSITVAEGKDELTVAIGTRAVTVKGDTSLTVQAGKRTVDVTGGDYIATSSNAVQLHGLGQGVTIEGVGGVGVEIDGTPEINAYGEKRILLSAGGSIEITPTAITISVAGSTIKLDATGVAVSGVKISLN